MKTQGPSQLSLSNFQVEDNRVSKTTFSLIQRTEFKSLSPTQDPKSQFLEGLDVSLCVFQKQIYLAVSTPRLKAPPAGTV